MHILIFKEGLFSNRKHGIGNSIDCKELMLLYSFSFKFNLYSLYIFPILHEYDFNFFNNSCLLDLDAVKTGISVFVNLS